MGLVSGSSGLTSADVSFGQVRRTPSGAELDGRPVVVTGSGVDVQGDDSRFDHQMRMWDLATGDSIGQPLSSGHDGYIDDLSCVRAIVVSGGQDHTMRVWDLATGDQLGPALTFPTWSHRVRRHPAVNWWSNLTLRSRY